MDRDNKIALNFLLIEPQDFKFSVYRKIISGNEEKLTKDILQYKLPRNKETEEWQQYWVSFEQLEDYGKYVCNQKDNIYLTEQFLFNNLLEILRKKIPDKIVKIEDRFYNRRIFLCLKEFNIGKQTVWIEPYYLKITKQFGFLVDFQFLKNKNIPNTKEIQRLSLSLDSNYHSNKSYYQDKFQIIYNFIRNYINELNPIVGNNSNISISQKFISLDSDFLKTKIYRFWNEETKNSQFIGIKDFGPFRKIKKQIHYFFIFKDEHLELGRELLKGLNGVTYKYTFPGMDKMFKIKLGKENVSKLVINSFDTNEIDKALKKINNTNYQNKLAIFIFPESESNFYYIFKNKFLQKGILTQGVHIETIKNASGLKWSISSIALQIFSKSGGIPWRVRPSNEHCLIIGIGKAHNFKETKDGKRQIEKFYAYSILVDSSGEYISMNVLSNENKEENYLNDIQQNLSHIIKNNTKEYQKIAFHIPFKIKKKELIKIINAIKQNGNSKEFIVIKINDKSKFFGYNSNVNSLVPYESSMIKLSEREYLIWPEGLNYQNTKTIKRYSNPIHIEFYFSNKDNLSQKTKKLYLQDVLNLSGANWRGFNAKSIPISMFYPQIISGFIKEFNTRGLDEINFANLPPWFL